MRPSFAGTIGGIVVFGAMLAAAPGRAADVPASGMPPNVEKIEAALAKRGVIPASATPEQRDAAVQAYLQQKARGVREGNPIARKWLDRNEEALNALASAELRGKKLGNTTTVAGSTPAFKPLAGADDLLLILVEFADAPFTWTRADGSVKTAQGPLHNQMPVPDNDFDLWVPDFSTQHYEDMLFTPGGWTFPVDAPRYAGEHRGSMHDYYLVQSFGQYEVGGKAYGWFQVGKPEAYYGDDNPAGGEDNLLPGTTRTLIADAVAVINARGAIDWAAYDADGDCVIDHPLFIHAGVDQSGGGGAQGDDAIWAHSSSVNQKVSGATATCPNGIFIRNYTIMPEDGGVGVFAHEFGHDLGLPDEYDTVSSGRGDSVGFWSLMSSGSWIGRPAQTQPSDISIWGRYALGWATVGDNVAYTTSAALATDSLAVRLEQSERWGGPGTFNAIRIDLPKKVQYVNTPNAGSWEWFGGKADELDTTLARAVDLRGKATASLSFWTWYDIEPNWDFGFVQVSTDGGFTWTSLALPGTTSVIDADGMPSIAENLPGFTGNSGGWVHETADLTAYAGQIVDLQFRYMTDWGTSMAGFFVDDMAVVADGQTVFADGAETLDGAWTATGWSRSTGADAKSHYYLVEWRNLRSFETAYGTAGIVNFDAGLAQAYQYDAYGSNPNQPLYFSYGPGLLLWYRDMSYTDNWTGYHPGGGFLLVVDAHDQALLRPPPPPSTGLSGYGSLPWNTRVQTYDAAFGLEDAPDFTLAYWTVTRSENGLGAVPQFDDSHTYWSKKASNASVVTQKYGLVFRVLGSAADGSAAAVGIGTK